MRSEPVGWCGSVRTARPPAASIASAISRSPQATTTGPTPAATARRQTWTIIGSPAMSASGLPGSRVEASRAGIRMIGFSGAALGTGLRNRWRRGATTCPVRTRAGSVIIRFSRGGYRTPMSSFEWNKIIASVLTAMIVAMVSGILAGSWSVLKNWKRRSLSLPGPRRARATGGGGGGSRARTDRALARQGRSEK